MPFGLQKSFTNGPTCGNCSKLLSMTVTGVLSRVLAVLREYILRVLALFRHSELLILLLGGSILCVLPVLRVMKLLKTPTTRNIWAFCTAHTPSTRDAAASTLITQYRTKYTRYWGVHSGACEHTGASTCSLENRESGTPYRWVSGGTLSGQMMLYPSGYPGVRRAGYS